jgi:hypothetical protein
MGDEEFIGNTCETCRYSEMFIVSNHRYYGCKLDYEVYWENELFDCTEWEEDLK